MGLGCDGVELGPGEQLVRRNQSFGHFSRLAGGDRHLLQQLFRMGEEKLQVEVPGLIEECNRLYESVALARVGSALSAG